MHPVLVYHSLTNAVYLAFIEDVPVLHRLFQSIYSLCINITCQRCLGVILIESLAYRVGIIAEVNDERIFLIWPIGTVQT